jgi:hypothetical protein
VAVTLRVLSNRLPAMAASLRPRASQVVRKTARDIAAAASANTTRVDTGAMKNGFQVEMQGDLTAVVFNTQDYFPFHELGTRYISAAPMLVPAAEKARPAFDAAMQQLASGL